MRNPKNEVAVHPAWSRVVLLCGIWDRAETADGTIESYALMTLPPDPAFEKYHDRAPLVLERGDDAAWLDSPKAPPPCSRRRRSYRCMWS